MFRRSTLRVGSALALALATFIALVALSAGTARVPVSADEAAAPVGPVCFYQDGHLVCVERPGSNAIASPDAVTPAALLTALLAGPTPEERAQGIESALPHGTRLVSVQADGRAITVRLAFPAGYLGNDRRSLTADGRGLIVFDALACDASVDQVFDTLLPLGYRDLHVQAEDPAAPGTFRPLATYLPPLTIPSKGGQVDTLTAQGQPPVEAKGRPRGALSGKTVYVAAGHGWLWNGYNWRTQRPPYPDASTGYVGPIIEDHNNAEVVNQYLLRYLWNAGADAWSARERDLNAFEQVVDDGHAGLVASGGWQAVGAGGYAARYLQATTSLAASAAVTWTTDPLPADGVYALYVWYVPGLDRAGDAHYTVYHAGGATELTVDQRHHGYTWRYVGQFPARAGQRLSVSLSNQSATPGRVVVADAIRLGGGWFDDSDLLTNGGIITTHAPYAPGKPWWEAAAFYNVQRMGVSPDDFESFSDVVARPLWTRWEHAYTGDDAVYVAWHSNGYNGHNTTFWGTLSFIHSDQAVTGSVALRHAIHSELVNDARAGWDPAWRDLGEASKDLGELRELWDENPAHAIPGVLLEIAYHDHVTDTNALKDPRFALLSARAVYQGIVEYFETRDGVDLTLLPEPPTHLVLRNDGPGRVTVSWRPSPTDSVGLVGDAAESYRVYTSLDGLGWDNGQAALTTTCTLTGLHANELIFVRVTAVNAGGESLPSPVLAARVSPGGLGQMLLVGGFERIDRYGLILEDDPSEGRNARLFPEQINSFDYVIEHGEAISLPFDSALNEAVADGDVSLALYNVVDWFLGEESAVDHTLDAAEQAALAAYLDGGSALFISGAEIGWDLVTRGNGPDFYRTYLGADMAGDDADTYVVAPTAEGIFAGLGPLEFRDNYDADYPDRLELRPGSTAALTYLGGNGGVAAIQYHAVGCRRVVYLGFPFETIAATQRGAVMKRVLDYLGADGCLPAAPQTAITTPASGRAFKTVPGFGGVARGFNPIERVEVQIEAPDGRYWDGQGWVKASRWLTAVGAADWHYPLPPAVLRGATPITTLEQGEYRLWARAWDVTTLSDTTPALTSFLYDSISPAAPELVAPADGITLATGPVAFLWRGPEGDTGSALGYNLQMDHLVLTQSITGYVPAEGFSNGVHTWRVRAFDAAGNHSPWTPTWTFVVADYWTYLPAIWKGYQTEESSICVDVVVNGGFETDEGWIINNTPLPAAYTTQNPRSGARSMRLGSVRPLTGTGAVSYSSVDQTLPLPNGISATLTLWLYPINENGDAGDLQYLGLYDEEGNWETLWSDRLDTRRWIYHQIDLTPYVNQVINLRFSVKNDGDDDASALYIDDVRLEVCGQ
jgi:hypothetical protein